MDRRRFLAAVPTTGAALGGCLAGDTATRQPPARTRTPPRDTPGRPSASAAYPADLARPYEVDRVVGYGDVDPETAPLYLAPSVESRTLPAAYSFTLHNHGDRPFTVNPYGWWLYRWEDDGWFYVAPSGAKLPALDIQPGGTYTWTLAVTNRGIDRPELTAGGRRNLTVRGLGGGTYAFGTDGWWVDGGDDGKRRVAAVARFRLAADQLALRPSTAVTGATRRGDTVTVTAERTYDDAVEPVPATFVLDRTEASPDGSLVTEQVLRHWPLRDALAYARPGVERVRVDAPARSTPPFDAAAWPPLEYEGGTFELSGHRRRTGTSAG